MSLPRHVRRPGFPGQASHIPMETGAKVIHVEVISPLPESWGVCNTCELMLAQADLGQSPPLRGLEEYPQEWQADWRRLAAILMELSEKYAGRADFHIIDPRSLAGMWKSLRYGVHVYPTFLLPGRNKVVGWDVERLETAIASQAASQATAQ
ncbi:MAG: hypothetical protein PHS96_04490 [Anaerolineales bacterium]|nr:hypothetical protein [Anaerolineales bacterium]